MAFKRVSSLTGADDPFEYRQMTDGEAATLGEALVETSGKLTKCGATATPEFIAMQSAAAATPGAKIAVERIREDVEYKVQSVATVAATLLGAKVTLHTDGLLVTATTTSGVFAISQTDGATTTSNVRGYFRR